MKSRNSLLQLESCPFQHNDDIDVWISTTWTRAKLGLPFGRVASPNYYLAWLTYICLLISFEIYLIRHDLSVGTRIFTIQMSNNVCWSNDSAQMVTPNTLNRFKPYSRIFNTHRLIDMWLYSINFPVWYFCSSVFVHFKFPVWSCSVSRVQMIASLSGL